jgi:hypothetical protein
MGGSSWSEDFYEERETKRATTGESAFKYDAEVKSSKVEAKVHEKMDPKGVTRESRDSEAHPQSDASIFIFDDTGSMGDIPLIFQRKLVSLHKLVTDKGYQAHPQFLMGAVGDAFSDRAALQVGQFESGIEIDDDLGRLWLQSGGGPYGKESYELALYFAARHTKMDCYEKRHKKGHLFISGDEMPYDEVDKTVVKKVFGDSLQHSIPLKEILAEAQEKYHVFFIIPRGHTRDGAADYWRNLLGQQALLLDQPEGICECVALAIGLTEGAIDLEEGMHHVDDLHKSTGKGSALVRRSVESAVSGYAEFTKSNAMVKVAGGLVKDGKATTRL